MVSSRKIVSNCVSSGFSSVLLNTDLCMLEGSTVSSALCCQNNGAKKIPKNAFKFLYTFNFTRFFITSINLIFNAKITSENVFWNHECNGFHMRLHKEFGPTVWCYGRTSSSNGFPSCCDLPKGIWWHYHLRQRELQISYMYSDSNRFMDFTIKTFTHLNVKIWTKFAIWIRDVIWIFYRHH